MKGLFLDDERNPSDVTWVNYPTGIEWKVVRNFTEFVLAVQSYNFEVMSLDHDLQDFSRGSEMTGYDCIKYFVGKAPCRITQPQVFVHSMNPVGKVNILSYWGNYLDTLK